MSAAQRDIPPSEEADLYRQPDRQAELKQQVAARLAAHRERRARMTPLAPELVTPSHSTRRPNAIAAAVAERYAHSPSYRTFLAEEARRAAQQAAAAAEIAQRNADAIAQAQQQLLQELDLWEAKEPSPGPVPAPPVANKVETPRVAAPKKLPKVPAPVQEPTQLSIPAETASPTTVTSAGLTVRLYEDLGPTGPAPVQTNRSFTTLADPDEHLTLDEEIAFRQAPVFEEPATPPVPIPANLLEFPRQLVATRKARPQLALGPLLETTAPPSGQLRIFEVEPEQISTEPTMPSMEPEWTSIWLDTPSPAATDAAYAAYTMEEPELHPNLVPGPLPPQTAAFGRRTMAAAVDAVLAFAGFVAFATVFITLAGTLPMGLPLALAAVAAVVMLAVLYHVLFFTFSDHTPGMRYARIALCTFDDENPTRKERQRRLWATLLAICPLGLGFAWAVLDDDSLGWHDRLSRTYQREY